MSGQITFDGDVVVITGAGGGLGRSHALTLASRGARVVVNDIGSSLSGDGTSASPADSVVAEIREAGGEAVANHDSIVTSEGAAAVIQTALDAFGRVDVVVNNAGVLRDAAFHKMDDRAIDDVIEVHLRGAFAVTRAAWGHFREQRHGRVVSTSSGSGLFGNFGQASYGAAKSGLVGLTNVLAIEGRKYGIHANVIAPFASTRMNEEALGDLARAVQPRFVSEVVAFLAHRDCPVSGRVYSCGGGRVARVFTGVTDGIAVPDLTAEDVAEHLDRIDDLGSFAVPADVQEEIDLGLRALGLAGAAG